MKHTRAFLVIAAIATFVVGAPAQRDLFAKRSPELRRQEMVLSMQASKTRGQISNLKLSSGNTRSGDAHWQVFKNKSGDVVYVKERLYSGRDIVGTREYFFEDDKMYHFAEESTARVSVFGRRERKTVEVRQRFFLDDSGRLLSSYRTKDGHGSGMSGGDVGSLTRHGYDLAGINR